MTRTAVAIKTTTMTTLPTRTANGHVSPSSQKSRNNRTSRKNRSSQISHNCATAVAYAVVETTMARTSATTAVAYIAKAATTGTRAARTTSEEVARDPSAMTTTKKQRGLQQEMDELFVEEHLACQLRPKQQHQHQQQRQFEQLQHIQKQLRRQ